MNEYLKSLLILCPLVFTAGLVDSIAGGGGLISIPAYLFAGFPAHIAAGTNKFAMSFGTLLSSRNFIKAKKIDYNAVVFSIPGAILGSAGSSKFALHLSSANLELLLLFALPAAAVILVLQKYLFNQTAKKEPSKLKFRVLSFCIGMALGAYDGIAGPGTGTFLILAFTSFLGIDLVSASGSAKITNLASNISALILFLLGKKVMLSVGIPAALCAACGNYIGSRLAIQGGEKYVRIVIFVVIGLLLFKCGASFL